MPRWRRATPAGRRRLLAAGVGLILAAAALVILYPRDGWVLYHGRAVTFNLRYPRRLHRVTAPAGAYARLEQRDAGGRLLRWFEVDPLRLLPSFHGEISGALPVFASSYVAALGSRTPGFLLQTEVKTRVNLNPGYTFTYRSLKDGRQVFGRVVMLLPALSGVRDGVILTMGTVPSRLVPAPDQVAANDLLQVPLRSFRFGT